MLKAEARNIYYAKRRSISPGRKEELDQLILERFGSLELPQVRNLLTYAPMPSKKEVNTYLIANLLAMKFPEIKIAYPVCNFADCTMKAVITQSPENLVLSDRGIPEPSEGDIMHPADFDIVLVPLLCFDKDGYRVGYGKGYYDKFLQTVRKDCIKIGLCYFEPVDSIEDRNEFDIPLNYYVTPDQVYAI
jgi:5-formyltetrahydrofolate cyclo-ligase